MNLQGPLWRFTGVRPAAWVFFAFLYIPILVLVALSFNSGQSATLWQGFSLKWYSVVANDAEILRAAKNSLIVATLATPGCTEAARAFACEMLALVGSAKSVPALAALLRRTETADAARFALEAIPGIEAEAALRTALSALTGDAKANRLDGGLGDDIL
jgi:ABC-type Fe3+ transport system permease subunit